MSCTKCRNQTCTCSSASCGSTAPYYNCDDVCVEDHIEKVYINRFSFGLCPTTSWNIPLCGFSATLNVGEMLGAAVGAFIYHESYGYFQINSIDAAKGQVVVVNTCLDGNADPGVQVPACTCFILTPPPSDSNGTATGVCVAVGFTAPAEGDCIDITVTGTTGLTASDTIQIGSGFYFLNEVKPDNIINICNQGEGIAPGTPVVPIDAFGNYLYCISIISSNPCDGAALNRGTLLACDGEGVTRPMGSPCEAGYIPVALNDCTVEMQPAIVPLSCTRLSEELQIVIADATYVLVVDDSSSFTTSDIVTISGMPGTRGDITAIGDATHISVTLDPVPGANQTLPAETTLICTISCCEEIQNELDCVVQGTRLAIPAQLNNQAITLGVGGDYEVVLDSNVIQYTAPSDCPGSLYHVRAEVNITCLIDSTYFDGDGGLLPGVMSAELQCDWSNNVGVGGRLNWTLTANDGVDFSTTYPATTENAIWGVLQILSGIYPVTYHGGMIIADTIVASGATITLRLNFKAINGDNFYPDEVLSMASYLIGNLVITKVT